MKTLHQELQGYQPLEVQPVKHNGALSFFIKEEVPCALSGTIGHVQRALEAFDRFGDVDWYQIKQSFEYLGDGSFSRVIVHPDDESKVIKLMLRLDSDMVCYQYLRLCAAGVISGHKWIPNIHGMGRIKYTRPVKPYEGMADKSLKDKRRVVNLGYVVLDRLYDSQYRDWDDVFHIEREFLQYHREYFPRAKLDIRGSNVMQDAEGNEYLTDPIWNGNGNELDPIYIPKGTDGHHERDFNVGGISASNIAGDVPVRGHEHGVRRPWDTVGNFKRHGIWDQAPKPMKLADWAVADAASITGSKIDKLWADAKLKAESVKERQLNNLNGAFMVGLREGVKHGRVW